MELGKEYSIGETTTDVRVSQTQHRLIQLKERVDELSDIVNEIYETLEHHNLI